MSSGKLSLLELIGTAYMNTDLDRQVPCARTFVRGYRLARRSRLLRSAYGSSTVSSVRVWATTQGNPAIQELTEVLKVE